MTYYKKKYLDCVKIYHKLHAELSSVTMKLTVVLDDVPLPKEERDKIDGILYDSRKRIEEIDIDFRKLIRSREL